MCFGFVVFNLLFRFDCLGVVLVLNLVLWFLDLVV